MSAQFAIEVEQDQLDAAARSRLYELFSQVFSFPGGEPGILSVAGGYLPDFEQFFQELPFSVPGANEQLPTFGSYATEDLRIRYTNLFESARGTIAVPLNESEFVDSPRSVVWEELIRFYEHFGLHYDGEKTRQWPDHLVIELECLQYLTFLQAGIKGNTRPLAHAQYDFIERHLLNWIPKLKERLARAEHAEPYIDLLELLYLFMLEDKTYLFEELDRN